MKKLSKNLFSICLVLTFVFCLNLVAFGQGGEAGEIDTDGGSKVVRIGVLLPKVKLTEAKGEVAPEEALRSTYAVLLDSDLFEVVALKSKLTSLALREAEKLKVDYILNVDLEQIQKKKKSGLFGRIARDTTRSTTRETARRVPYGGGAGERIARTTAQSTIINTGYTMSDMTVKVRKNDKFTLDYNLTTPKGKVFYSNKLEAKAKKKNDETLMNLIEESANDMVTQLTKKLPQ